MGWFDRQVRLTATLAAAVLVALAFAGSGRLAPEAPAAARPTASRAHPITPQPGGKPMPLATPDVVQGAGGVPAPAPEDGPAAAAPARIDIPFIGVSAGLGTVGLNSDGTIQVPGDWNQPAWFVGSPTPGAVGPAVIVGHLDSYVAPAVFWNLHRLQAGAAIVITRGDGSRLTFTVTNVIDYPQSAFPTQTVYGQTVDPELRLITCGGTYQIAQGRYDENTVVFATLTSTAAG
jgi:Sortase domain